MQGSDDELPGRALPAPADALSHSLDPDEPPPGPDPGTRSIPLLERAITSGSLLGPFLVRRLLADGGMGKVFLAEDRQGQPVALKVLSLQNACDEATRLRFDREGAILARLKHPNIVALLARGVDEPTGRAYLALEYVPGQDLSNLLQRCEDNRLSVDEAVFVLERCARALQAAHEIGVLHRDMKPANVLVTRDGQVKLTDFGVALLVDDPVRLTAIDHVMGTLPYLAPEVLGDGVWTAAGDVYGLGCLAFKLMTGQPPFPQRQVHEVVAAHRRQEAPSLLEFVPDAPPALADLLAIMLSKDPARRPTAEQVEAALRGLGLAERTDRVAQEWLRGRVGARAFPSGRFPVLGERPASGPPRAATGRHAPPEPERLDRYQVLSRLGKGSMGEVYLVRDPGGGAPLALKVLASDLLADAEARERFRRELASMTRLGEHPAIVRARGHGLLPDGRPFYVMDYVQGRSLKEALRAGLGAPAALDALEQVLEGLAHAHAAGFVHRDVKPENVLLDDEGRARLADFGLVKALAPGQRSLTVTGEVLGTPTYMAPEQVDASVGEVGPWTDVYAAGAVAYEALVGAPPHAGATALEVYTKLVEAAPVRPPRALRPDVPEALEAVVLRALARRPADRPPDARALLVALRAARAGPSGRGARLVRRLAVGAVGAVIFAAAALATQALRREADRARNDAPAVVTRPAPAREVEEALLQGDAPLARTLLGAATPREVPVMPWVLALAGDGDRAMAACTGAEVPPQHLARIAAWTGDWATAARALEALTPPARARALALELTGRSGRDDASGTPGWSALARAEAALATGDGVGATIEFEEAARVAQGADQAEVRLCAALGLMRAALARGALDQALDALARAAGLANHPLDRGRVAAWSAVVRGRPGATAPAPPAALGRARALALGGDAAGALAALRDDGLVGGPVGGVRAGAFVEAETALLIGGAGLGAGPALTLTAAAEAGGDVAGAEQALEALALAARLDPTSPAVALGEARATLVTGDLARAAAGLERARTLAPDDPLVALVGARLRAAHVVAAAQEADAARLARAADDEARERALADAWAGVVEAARVAAAGAAPRSALAVEARLLAARAGLERLDRLRRAGATDEGDVRQGLLGDLAAAVPDLAGPLAAARGRLVRALLDDEGADGATVDLAEAALAAQVQRAAAPPGLVAVEEALLLLAAAGGEAAPLAAQAHLALAGDATARATLRLFRAADLPRGAARREVVERALALAPDAGPVLLAAALDRAEAGDLPAAAALLARAAAADADLTWPALRALARRSGDQARTARLADDAVAIAHNEAQAALTRALVAAAGAAAAPGEPAWRAAAAAAARAVALDPGGSAAHLLRALTLARAGLTDDATRALACARAAAPTAAAPALLALHLGLAPDEALDRCLTHGHLRDHAALAERPEGGVDPKVEGRLGAALAGNLASIEGGFDPRGRASARGPWALARRLEEQERLPRLALGLRLGLVGSGRAPAGVGQEAEVFQRLVAALPEHERARRAGATAVFLLEGARGDRARRGEAAARAGAAALAARAATDPATRPLPAGRALAWLRRADAEAPRDRAVGLALEERARRPELLFVVRCGLEQALAPRRPLLAPEDLAAPWSASRALLEGARAGDAQQRTLAWLVEDGAWSEVLLAVGRAAAFRAGRDGLDGELRDLLEEELADEAAWGEDPERRRAAWRVVAAAARDGRALARDPAERSALAGLLADALLYEAGCLEPGAERQRLLTRARALAAESAPEQVRGGRRPLEATWRQARVLGALDDPGFAGAFQALAAAVMRADAGELGRLGRRARRDPLLPLLVERPGYAALTERLGRR